MNWVEELRQAFSRLQAGEEAQVSFAEQDGVAGEAGREFNALAAAWVAAGGAWSREELHRQRNRLAGILAVVQVENATGRLGPAEKEAVDALLEEARKLEARLRQG